MQCQKYKDMWNLMNYKCILNDLKINNLYRQQELEKLRTGLENVQKERLDQVTLFKGKYREMKDEMHSLIKTVESHDAQYATLKETFFTAAHQIEKEIRKVAKESLAVVPTSSTRSIKKARH